MQKPNALALALVTVVAGTFAVDASANVSVTATLPSLGAIVKEVGGDNVDVDVLAAPTQDPHYVDAKPSLVLRLNKAKLVVQNGLELENAWLKPLLLQARNPGILPGTNGFFDASQYVHLLGVPAGRIDRSMGDIHPGGNPHYLFDPRAAAAIAVAVGNKLATVDPEHTDLYKKRAAEFASKCQIFATEQTARFAKVEAAKRKVVSYHDSLGYLYDWLQLTQVATLEPKPGVPPDPGHVAQVLSIMKQQQVGVIVGEEFYPSSTSKTLANMTKGQLVVLPGGARFSEGQGYLAHMKIIADDLAKALGTP